MIQPQHLSLQISGIYKSPRANKSECVYIHA